MTLPSLTASLDCRSALKLGKRNLALPPWDFSCSKYLCRCTVTLHHVTFRHVTSRYQVQGTCSGAPCCPSPDMKLGNRNLVLPPWDFSCSMYLRSCTVTSPVSGLSRSPSVERLASRCWRASVLVSSVERRASSVERRGVGELYGRGFFELHRPHVHDEDEAGQALVFGLGAGLLL